MKYFMDTHDKNKGTFPTDELSAKAFMGVLDSFEKICAEEGVTYLRANVNLQEGRAFCFTMAPDADAVRRAHERANLPFDEIVEVSTVTASDLLGRELAAE